MLAQFSINSLLLTLVTAIPALTDARALPPGTPLASPSAAFQPCLTIDSTTVQWFLSTTYMRKIPCDQCIFYTRRTNGETVSLSNTATKFAHNHGLVSIWMVWPSNSTITSPSDLDYYSMYEPSSALRCIHDLGQEHIYFSRMSEAYARLCSGRSYVMTDHPDALPHEGIWWDTEYPTLSRAGGEVDEIVSIDVQGRNAMMHYDRCRRQTGMNVTVALPQIVPRDVLRRRAVRVSEPAGMDILG